MGLYNRLKKVLGLTQEFKTKNSVKISESAVVTDKKHYRVEWDSESLSFLGLTDMRSFDKYVISIKTESNKDHSAHIRKELYHHLEKGERVKVKSHQFDKVMYDYVYPNYDEKKEIKRSKENFLISLEKIVEDNND